MLVGCGLRCAELSTLELRHVQQRDGRAVLADLVGKGRRIRSVAMPPFVEVAIKDWTAAAGSRDYFRRDYFRTLFGRVRRRQYLEATVAAISDRNSLAYL